MHSLQKRWRHSREYTVEWQMSRQTGHLRSCAQHVRPTERRGPAAAGVHTGRGGERRTGGGGVREGAAYVHEVVLVDGDFLVLLDGNRLSFELKGRESCVRVWAVWCRW